jgi:hypothetical protein
VPGAVNEKSFVALFQNRPADQFGGEAVSSGRNPAPIIGSLYLIRIDGRVAGDSVCEKPLV